MIILCFSQTTFAQSCVQLYIAGNYNETPFGNYATNNSNANLWGNLNGNPIKPHEGPCGTVVVNGAGTLNYSSVDGNAFESGGGQGLLDGVYFGTGGSQSANSCYYLWSGADVGNYFSTCGGSVDFYLRSSESWATRLAANTQDWVFDVNDTGSDPLFHFYAGESGTSLILSYQTDSSGGDTVYTVPATTEDALYGNGVVLHVNLQWDGTNNYLTLNGTLVNTQAYTPISANWGANSYFIFGAGCCSTKGKYTCTDGVADFQVSSSGAGPCVCANTPTNTPTPAMCSVPDLMANFDSGTDPTSSGGATLISATLPATGSFMYDNTQNHGGPSGDSIKFTWDNTGGGWVALYVSVGSLTDWTSYTQVSFWAKGQSGGEPFIFQVRDHPADDQAWAYFGFSAATTWTQYTVYIPSNLNPNREPMPQLNTMGDVAFLADFNNPGGPYTIWIDDIQFCPPRPTATPTQTASNTATSTSTPTASITATVTVTGTASGTGTATRTSSLTVTVTSTSSATATPTFTGTSTPVPTSTTTNTITQTATITSTATVTVTPSQTTTAAPTSTPSQTATASPTFVTTPPAPGNTFIYPSPATGDTAEITYFMTGPGTVKIRVYNDAAQLVETVADEKQGGPQESLIDTKGLATGVYLYIINITYQGQGNSKIGPKKFMVLK